MKATILISALSLGLLQSAGLAQDAERPPRPIPPVIAALDANDDNVISEEEMENAPEALARLDKNEDGELTRDELRPEGEEGDEEGRPPRPEGDEDGEEKRGRRRPMPPIMEALDKNGDGTISKREMKRAERALSRLDRNGDDELTPDELGPPPHEGGGEDGEQGDRQGPPPHDGGGRPPRGGRGGR